MKLSAILAPMIAANVPGHVILETVKAFEEAQTDALAERRRADADRQARKRDREKSRDITLRHSDRPLTGEGARVEDKSLTTEIEPQQEEKIRAPASPSPRQRLEAVLDAERADAIIEHRKRIKAPLTSHAAKLLAKELAKCPDPNAAADMILLKGWRGFDASWLGHDTRQRAGPAVPASPMDHFRNFASEINGQDRDDRRDSGHRNDAPGIPVRTIEHH